MWFFSSEHHLVQNLIREFAHHELAPYCAQLDREESFNEAAFKKLGNLGLLGATVPENEGGSGLDTVATTLIMEEMASVDASTTLSYLAHTILCVHQISRNAHQDQKNRYLPPLIQGQKIGGMGMSEPDCGSDVLGMQTRAERQGDSYILNGTKTWITNGPIGDLFYCYARTGPERYNFSTFIIERGTPGFFIGKKISKMGMRASPTGELVFQNCHIPKEQRIGEEGDSVPRLMANLNLERVTISGISLGLAKASLQVASQYAQERRAFGKPIGRFQQIQEHLAESSAWYAACRSLTYEAAKLLDLGGLTPIQASSLAAKAKLQSAQMATQVALKAIQILGGSGYSCDFPVERYMRDAKLLEIGAGTNEILRILIARELLGKNLTEFY